jgi:hypothetical protein
MAFVAVALMPAAMRCFLLLGLFGLLGLLLAGAPASAQSRNDDEAMARSSRPRVVIQPRRARLGPNARRECRARLVQEYRVSGTVIVPQTYCWWE